MKTEQISIHTLIRRTLNLATALPSAALAMLVRRTEGASPWYGSGPRGKAGLNGEDVFRAAFEFSAVGVAVVDLEGRILRVNPKLAEITGYSVEELAGIKIPQLHHPDDWERTRAAYRQMIAGEAREVLTEKRYIRKDGATIWVRANATLARDETGRPQYAAGVVEDITEWKRAEEQLRASEARFRAAFEVSAVGIVQAALDGRIQQANPKMVAITGYSAEELLGLTYIQLTHPDDRELTWAATRRLIAGELGEIQMEKRFVRKDEETIWVQVNATLVRDEAGRPQYTAAVIQDITKRKRVEDELHQRDAVPHAGRRRSRADLAGRPRPLRPVLQQGVVGVHRRKPSWGAWHRMGRGRPPR